MGVRQSASLPDPAPAPRWMAAALASLACLAAVALDAPFLIKPLLFTDDLDIAAESWTWEQTVAGLWVPHNEHTMPLGRLLTYGLVRLAGGPTGLPRVFCWLGPVALVAAMLLLRAFVRRELGDVRYALLAMTLFGVTSVYMQTVWWFSASFAMLVVDMLLLGLLAAQAWRRGGGALYLAAVLLAAALAPGWFASGILVGPLIAVYLFPWRQFVSLALRAGVGLAAALAGSALFLIVSLPRSGSAVLHAEHYGGKTAIEAFNLTFGVVATCRSIVDNLFLGVFGYGGLPWAIPLPLVPILLAGLIWLLLWWWRPALRSGVGVPFLPLGLALIAVPYVLFYSARADWGYERMTLLSWNRYHLMPQLGLALLIAGGLPARWQGCVLDSAGLSRRLGLLVGVCFLVQLPRALLGYLPLDAIADEQRPLLRKIEEVDARCREYHVSAAAAQEALEPLLLQELHPSFNGWKFLKGSDDPRPLPPEEVRRLLGETGAGASRERD